MRTKLLLCTILFLGVLSLSARAQNDKGDKNKSYLGTNEIEISVGLTNPIYGWTLQLGRTMTDLFLTGNAVASELIGAPGVDNYEAVEIAGRNMADIPTFRLEYGHNVLDWMHVGAGVYYAHYEYPLQYIETQEFAWKENLDIISIMANIRFYWLNREWVRMYSSMGFGLSYIHTNILSQTADGSKQYKDGIAFAYDIRLIGLTVGKSLYGKFELGGYSSGIVSAGIGYRF